MEGEIRELLVLGSEWKKKVLDSVKPYKINRLDS